jgi:hypothetical protein
MWEIICYQSFLLQRFGNCVSLHNLQPANWLTWLTWLSETIATQVCGCAWFFDSLFAGFHIMHGGAHHDEATIWSSSQTATHGLFFPTLCRRSHLGSSLSTSSHEAYGPSCSCNTLLAWKQPWTKLGCPVQSYHHFHWAGTYLLPTWHVPMHHGPEGEDHFTFFFVKITIHVSSVQNQSICMFWLLFIQSLLYTSTTVELLLVPKHIDIWFMSRKIVSNSCNCPFSCTIQYLVWYTYHCLY